MAAVLAPFSSSRTRVRPKLCRTLAATPFRSTPTAQALLGALVGAALWLPAPSVRAQAGPAAAETLRSFDVPAGTLDQALSRLGRQAGAQIAVNAELTAGLTSQGVSGSYTVLDALQRLLAGTGLEAVRDASGEYTLRKAVPRPAREAIPPQAQNREAVLPTVKVTAQAERANGLPKAYAGGQVARGARLGVLGNTDIMDTPFNITSYTAELIENQQARSVGDVLVNDPSVRSAATAGAPGEYLLIRGFPSIEDSIFFNGLAGMAPNNRSSVEMVERVEVLKGPSAAISGMVPDGSVGGSVMLVPKRAADEPLTRIGLDYATRSQLGTRVDIGRRFGENKAWGIRVNGVLRNGEGYVQSQDQRTGLASVALDYRGERLRMALDAYDQKDKRDGASDYFFGFSSQPSAVPDASRPITLGSTAQARDRMLMARVEYDLTSQVTAFAAFGKRSYHSDFIRAVPWSVDQSGNYTAAPMRERFNGDLSSAEMGLRAQVNTGAISHRIALT